jgi:WD40 repeat protein
MLVIIQSFCIFFSNRNILASASVDKLVKIWDVAAGKCI